MFFYGKYISLFDANVFLQEKLLKKKKKKVSAVFSQNLWKVFSIGVKKRLIIPKNNKKIKILQNRKS